MDIWVLGPVEVLVEGESVALGGPRQRALLGVLMAAAPRVVSVDRLIEGIWGEDSLRPSLVAKGERDGLGTSCG